MIALIYSIPLIAAAAIVAIVTRFPLGKKARARRAEILKQNIEAQQIRLKSEANLVQAEQLLADWKAVNADARQMLEEIR